MGALPCAPRAARSPYPRGEASLLLPVPDSFSGDGFEVANMGGEFPLKNKKKIKNKGKKVKKLKIEREKPTRSGAEKTGEAGLKRQD